VNSDRRDPSSPSEAAVVAAHLEAYQAGQIGAVELSERILRTAIRSQGDLTPDHDRRRRCGYLEVVYAEGKPIDRLLTVIEQLLQASAASSRAGMTSAEEHPEVLATRVSIEQARAVCEAFPLVRWNAQARTIRVGQERQPQAPGEIAGDRATGTVAVVSAGTTDAAVAEEARETLAWMKVRSHLIQDVGVAGPYRLLAHLDTLRACVAIVVVAGMEGALPSVVAGHLGAPIIAVPTSVGYGANFHGLSALLTMLNSCASNVATVNIDAGFRGGYLAGLIARRSGDSPEA
jgi:NCAIR mutase (PurE)-related protein